VGADDVPDITSSGELVVTPMATAYDRHEKTHFNVNDKFTKRGDAFIDGAVDEPRINLIRNPMGIFEDVPVGLLADYNDFRGAHFEEGTDVFNGKLVPDVGELDEDSLPMVMDRWESPADAPNIVGDMGRLEVFIEDEGWTNLSATLFRQVALEPGVYEETHHPLLGWRDDWKYGMTFTDLKRACAWFSRHGHVVRKLELDPRFAPWEGAEWMRNSQGRLYIKGKPFTKDDKQHKRWTRYYWGWPMPGKYLPVEHYERRLRVMSGRPNVVWQIGGESRETGKLVPWEKHIDTTGADLFRWHVELDIRGDQRMLGLKNSVQALRWKEFNDTANYFRGDHRTPTSTCKPSLPISKGTSHKTVCPVLKHIAGETDWQPLPVEVVRQTIQQLEAFDPSKNMQDFDLGLGYIKPFPDWWHDTRYRPVWS
jgi:hypothetical protein